MYIAATEQLNKTFKIQNYVFTPDLFTPLKLCQSAAHALHVA